MSKNKKTNLVNALLDEKKTIVTNSPPKPTVSDEKKPLYIRLNPAAKKQLDILRIETDAKSLQALVSEAINDLFLKYGKEPIA